MDESSSRGTFSIASLATTKPTRTSLERTRILLVRDRRQCTKAMLLYNQKNVLNIWSEHNYMLLSHRLVHTTTCFGPVYWPSSGCIINFMSSYTICAWVTLGGRDLVCKTRSRPPGVTHAHIV